MKNINFSQKILILDSGLGGLSVYKYLVRKLPNLSYTYVFDNEFFPYGNRKESFIIKRVIRLIDQIQRDREFEIIILACNTVSVVSINILKDIFSDYIILGSVPEIDVAIQFTKNKVIYVLATKRTIEYIRNKVSFYSKEFKIHLVSSSKLVRMIEEKIRGKIILKNKIYSILKNLSNHQIPDTIVLGCTHYSFISKEIKEAFPKCINLIDSKKNIYDDLTNYVYKRSKKKEYYDKYHENMVFFTKSDYKMKELSDFFKRIGFLKMKKITI
ncbi:hypothetical protein AOE56_02620 [Candidatus Riesia pediculicola]|nr:hypothetical protein AOE56_02620 [Candidatus Riesia pediculicola]